MKTSTVNSNPASGAPPPVEGQSAYRARPSIGDIRAVQPRPGSEGAVGLLYRHFSLPLTWLLVQTPMTANQISVLWAIVGLVGVALLASGIYAWNIVGALCLQLAAILDRVDGEVARYKKSQSMLGVFWDLAGHILIKSFLFAGISLGVYRSHPSLVVIILGISAGSSLIVGHVVRFYKGHVFRKHGLQVPKKSPARTVPSKLLEKTEHLWWTLGLFGIILAGALTNYLYYVLILYGALTPFWALGGLLRCVRDVRAEDLRRIQNPVAGAH